MRRRSIKIIVAGTAATAVLGVGVAAAADPPTCPYGNTPKAGAVQRGDQVRDRDRQQLRKRDGTGPRHGQGVVQHRNRGKDCPYRS